ncbi:hypothetical protein [Cellulomonas sp. NPDC089187]|uniref:hypothetical protein n=1 Tax=Cellulomonas sp. NPDC089187 TaxID=3154970 RepID=UPI003414E82C
MAVADFFVSGSPDAGKAVVREALDSAGFTIEAQLPNGGWTVGRGSKWKTATLGALAGKKAQRLTFTVLFFDHQGTMVVRLERETGSGMMAGAVGVARSNDIFEETVAAVGNALYATGALVGSNRG